MRKLKYLILLSISINFFAAGAQAEIQCNQNDFVQKDIYDFPTDGYWMQYDGKCFMTFTSHGGFKSQRYDLCHRQTLPISSFVDAFPIPDTNLYVHPGPIRFYSFDELDDAAKKATFLKKGKTFEDVSLSRQGRILKRKMDPLHTEPALASVYQSIGVLEKNEKEMKIRVSIGFSAGDFMDMTIENYNTKIETPEDRKKIKIKTVSKYIRMCPNLRNGGLDTQLPMLSRDGRMIATMAPSGGMAVYKVADTGICEKISDIPHATSKVNFSFDGKKVFYVTYDESVGHGRLAMLNLDKSDVKNADVTYLSATQEDVKYMTSAPNGDVYYTTIENGNKLILLDQSQLKTDQDTQLSELGYLYLNHCKISLKGMNNQYAAAEGRRLSQSSCYDLVKNGSADLMKICDGKYKSSAEKTKGSGSVVEEAGKK
jgi:hypothetical protein